MRKFKLQSFFIQRFISSPEFINFAFLTGGFVYCSACANKIELINDNTSAYSHCKFLVNSSEKFIEASESNSIKYCCDATSFIKIFFNKERRKHENNSRLS
jgi:hypothetical protein